MNKMYKVLATTSILAMAAMPIAASAQSVSHVNKHFGQVNIQHQDVPPATTHNGHNGFIVNQANTSPGTLGKITDYVNDKTGKFITVTGRGLAVTDQSEIVLAITKNTKIVDSKGKKVSLNKIINKKMVVKAYYGANITRSLPARGTAIKLVAQEQSFLGINGTITEVKDNGIVVKGTGIYSSKEETVMLRFAPKAKILDQEGKAIKASAIQPGMSVKAFYGPAATKSNPPQSTANYVLVDTRVQETDQKTVIGTDGIITNITNSYVTVIGNPMEKGGADYVVLKVDEKTKIVDQNGQPLTLAALKSDIRIDAYYGEVMTMSYPAQTHADKIVVKATEVIKVEGTIMASDHTSEGQVYVDVGSDQSTNNDIILNIWEKTKVIPLLSSGTELRVGTKIVAYHSPVMTRSLPGITNAEVVIVTSVDNAVTPK
ncbi:peptidase [Cohnella sp. WQ 127256]|uniref:peptidase n=1 Tax=Cohnella sp. WQ 127256 TaxID=2938790 RepID=UPI0021178F6A|nr:peptidase [Cohnella sp. WQ 127256]